MERAAGAVCVVPAQRIQVLYIRAVSRVLRRHCESMRLPAYGCLGEQQANGNCASFAICALDGCVLYADLSLRQRLIVSLARSHAYH